MADCLSARSGFSGKVSQGYTFYAQLAVTDCVTLAASKVLLALLRTELLHFPQLDYFFTKPAFLKFIFTNRTTKCIGVVDKQNRGPGFDSRCHHSIELQYSDEFLPLEYKAVRRKQT